MHVAKESKTVFATLIELLFRPGNDEIRLNAHTIERFDRELGRLVLGSPRWPGVGT